MSNSVRAEAVQAILDQALQPQTRRIDVQDQLKEIATPFPSPEDWRDTWIYFLLIDRFNNDVPNGDPRHPPFDSIFEDFQGGSFNGVRAKLDYLKDLGVGAIWLSPVLKNCQFRNTYHGYGIQDFLEIEPRFASSPEQANDEFRALVDEAHARGIYIICDIVLHHSGDVFAYELSPNDACAAQADLRWPDQYPVHWRDAQGHCLPGNDPPQNPPNGVGVRPLELLGNQFFGRHGDASNRPAIHDGDFCSLKGLETDFEDPAQTPGHFSVRDTLIRAYQHFIAKFDIDGYRIDTLKHVSPDFAQVFGNAIREFALSIGKRNFFTFGEVADEEEVIARFVGRNAALTDAPIGVDAALDFPLFKVLPSFAKGGGSPADIVGMYSTRKQAEKNILSTHGDATNFFVTFLDNHDQNARFYFSDPADPHRFDDQLTLGLACLFALQGIPCVYYGTEQGLHGLGSTREAAREALWGKPNAFDTSAPFYRALRQIAALRRDRPALRYGRQYMRPLSGDGTHFHVSETKPGVLAFSRILTDQEVVVVANACIDVPQSLEVLVDRDLTPAGSKLSLLYSNNSRPMDPGRIQDKGAGTVEIHEVDGRITAGPARSVRVTLQPMEVQVLANF